MVNWLVNQSIWPIVWSIISQVNVPNTPPYLWVCEVLEWIASKTSVYLLCDTQKGGWLQWCLEMQSQYRQQGVTRENSCAIGGFQVRQSLNETILKTWKSFLQFYVTSPQNLVPRFRRHRRKGIMLFRCRVATTKWKWWHQRIDTIGWLMTLSHSLTLLVQYSSSQIRRSTR